MRTDENKVSEQLYVFDEFRLDPAKRLLFRADGETVPLMPKALDILGYLVAHAGKVIEKDDLMTAIWPDTVVEENNLTQNISALRKALGEKHRENRFIATVPGRGYKFVAPVRGISDADLIHPPVKPDNGSDAQRRRDHRAEMPASDAGPRRGVPIVLAVVAALTIIAGVTAGLFIWRDNARSARPAKIGSLAVLPFKPLLAGNRDESLELGMADSMIAKLGSGDLRVRPLAAVRRFDAVDQDPLAAGRELAVEAVLDGSIQIANGRVRISAKLISVPDGKQLWAGQYDERSTDIFALQDSISQRVAGELQIALGERARKNYTASVEAYQLFAKGKFHSSRLILPEVKKGIVYFEQAIAIDPGYAMAYVELANAYRAMVLTNDARPSEVMPRSREAALKAAELDAGLAEAQTALASTAFWYEFDPQKSERHFIRALELDPSSTQSRLGYAHLLSNIGRHEEAISEIKRALEIDPVNLIINALYGQILFFAGSPDESLTVLKATAELDRSFWLVHLFMSRAYASKGMWDEAAAAAAAARDLANGNAEAISIIGYAQARAGRTDDARNSVKELESRSTDRYVPHYAIASIYNGLGEREKALDLLEKSFAERDALMVFLKVEPKWDNLRSEQRFVELMRRMNFN